MRPIPATSLGDAHGLLRAIDKRGRLRTDEFVTEFNVDELFPAGLENALGRLRHFISFGRAAGLVKEDRGVVELTDIGQRYIRAGDAEHPFKMSPQQAEWLRRQLREKHMTDSIYHGLAIGLSLLASCPPGTRVSTLDFGRSMAYLGRAGWDNENTLQIQGERHLRLLQDMEMLDENHRVTPTGDQVRGELTLPVHMSLVDIAGQQNPGGPEAVRVDAEREWAQHVASAPPPAAEPPGPAGAEEDDDNDYHDVGPGAWAPAEGQAETPQTPIVPRAEAPAGQSPGPASEDPLMRYVDPSRSVGPPVHGGEASVGPAEAGVPSAPAAGAGDAPAGAVAMGAPAEAGHVPSVAATTGDGPAGAMPPAGAGAGEPGGAAPGGVAAAGGAEAGGAVAGGVPAGAGAGGVEAGGVPAGAGAGGVEAGGAVAGGVPAGAGVGGAVAGGVPAGAGAGGAVAGGVEAGGVSGGAALGEIAAAGGVSGGAALGGIAAAGRAVAGGLPSGAGDAGDAAGGPAAGAGVPGGAAAGVPGVGPAEASGAAAAGGVAAGVAAGLAAAGGLAAGGLAPAGLVPSADVVGSAGVVPREVSVGPPMAGGPVSAPSPAGTEFVGARTIQAAAETAGLRLPETVYVNAAAALATGKHLLLTGAPGAGKTALAMAIARAAAQAGRADGATVVTAGPGWAPRELLLEAASRARWVIVDELDRADVDEALGALSSFLAGTPIALDGGAEAVPAAGWRIVATWGGTPPRASAAVLRRFAVVEVGAPSGDEVRAALHQAAGGDPTAVRAAERLLPLAELAPLGAGVFVDAARHAAARQSLAPADDVTLAREAFAAYVAPLLGDLDADGERRVRELLGGG